MKNRILQVYLLVPVFSLFSGVGIFAQGLTLTPGSHFVVNGSPSLVVNNAAIQNNGTFTAGSGTVILSGYSDTAVSYINGDSTTVLNNFTINKTAYGAAAKGAVWVNNTLTMATGNLYPDSKLTLKSYASNTARVAPVPSNCSIIGKTNVERYYPSHRAWQLVTAPITSANTIYNAWQNGGVYAPGIGTYVTGKNPSSANGLDPSPQDNYSMYSFSNSAQQFGLVTNTYTNVSQGNNGSADNTGYMLFVRGDRAYSNLYTTGENATTLSSLGSLQTGTQTFTASSVSGNYTLIGNPYASPIDFSTVTRNNVINRFYVWDPNLNTIGGFVVFDDFNNTGTYIKSVASGDTSIIQSSQAFFVQTYNNGAASLVFNESNKSSINNDLAFRPVSGPAIEGLAVSLYLLNTDSSTTLADGALAQFDNSYSDSITLADAIKLGNMNEALSFLKQGKSLSILRSPLITSADTFFLKLTQTTMRSYQFQFAGQNFGSSSLMGILQDTYLGTNTPINLAGNTTVNFTLSSTASAATNRFRIVFTMPSAPLAVTFTAVKAYQKNSGINVEWDVQNEFGIAQYEVEKSSDGINFTKVNTTMPTGNNNSSVNYNWLDTKPFTGNNYYRIESIDKTGVIKYSQVIRVSIDKTTTSDISIYPNPVVGNVVNIQFNNQTPGNYQVHLLNNAGALVYSQDIPVTSNNIVQSLPLPATLAKGSYEIKTIGPKNAETVQNIIIQ